MLYAVVGTGIGLYSKVVYYIKRLTWEISCKINREIKKNRKLLLTDFEGVLPMSSISD